MRHARITIALGALLNVPGLAMAQAAKVAALPPELVRIDGDREQFGYFTALAASNKGVLAVAQQLDGAIRFYAPSGERIASFGRKGAGPGEFRTINLMGWRGDTLWVVDNSLARITFLSAAGKFLRAESAPVSVAASGGVQYRSPRVVAIRRNGDLLLQASVEAPPPPNATASVTGRATVLFSAKPDGTLPRLVARVPANPCFYSAPGAQMIYPLCPEPTFAATSDGDHIGVLEPRQSAAGQASMVLTMLGARGDTVFSRTYPLPSVALTDFVHDSIETELRNGPAVFRGLVTTTAVPRFYPPVRHLVIGPTGEAWVGLVAAPGAPKREWRVVGPGGASTKTLWLPRSPAAFALEPRGIWTYVADADGVESLVLFSQRTPK